MQILISHNSKEPIYEQIVNQIKTGILANELPSGYALPSMRNMAKDLDVSVITTKRAYEELEKAGLIYSVVGKGSFVSEQNLEMIIDRKQKVIEEQLSQAIKNSKEIGLSLDEIQELITLLYEEMD
ncbi:GntR family transcriptional regulator [Lysinibacillus sp. 2017]|uniref:GntR family transcriptional regulator n=1 Tax=unclassified Lysinibacillus TaxID=2636778 RepID=UPI000D526B2C|nr:MULTISPECIES: GntR family transcriptional regulator [unclassified Lysinibacillus]AWE07307.1 GntR family transcriptional regulator [Lysinibacillus sp. 2017]TGN32067.1 GntR family transcriptional regulator [Lysinibacillus sp. S2017]